jgi:exopolysaccharide biosynthesis polyprenyl glycosylphosphotransferase
MTTPQRQLLITAFPVADLILLGIVLDVSVFGSGSFMPLSVLTHKTLQVQTIFAILALLFLWKPAFKMIGLYQSKRLTRPVREFPELLKAAAVATIILAVVALVFRVRAITPTVLWRFLPLSISSLTASRFGLRYLLKAIRQRGRNLRQVIVVGTNARAVNFASSILTKPELGYRLAGFVDDVWVGPGLAEGLTRKLVSNLVGFPSFLRNHVVDEVVIALPIKSFYEKEDGLLRTCREHGIIVRILTDLFDASPSEQNVNEFASAPLLTFSSIPIDTLRLVAKRAIDIAVSSLLLIVLSPVFLAAYILVKLDSKGPAIFAQKRIGLNKRRFRIYKFRSMVANAEKLQAQLESHNEAQGPVFKIKHDPRITRVGRILRKTSIDELPQLFNVLIGDMSLVGPRPLPVRDYNGFDNDWQRRRFSVRPGVTCLWQVSGRSSVTFDQWMRLDMEYIDQWSLWLDMKILARTIPAVVKGIGAA